MKAYWFSTNGKPQQGSNRYNIGPDPYVQDGEIIPCINGLHASCHPLDALLYASSYSTTVDIVEMGGFIVHDPIGWMEKVVASHRTHVKRVALDHVGIREFTRWCALQVVDDFDFPSVVKEYLKTNDSNLRDQASNYLLGTNSTEHEFHAVMIATLDYWSEIPRASAVIYHIMACRPDLKDIIWSKFQELIDAEFAKGVNS